MKRQLPSLVLIVVLLLTMTAACSNTESSEQTTTTTPTAENVTTVTTTLTGGSSMTTVTTGKTGASVKTVQATTTTVNRTTTTQKTIITTTTTRQAPTFPVKPMMDISIAAQYVNNRLDTPKTKIRSECFVVADYDPEYAFAHQPGFAYFNGKFYASWASGIKDEDSPGQRCVVSSSVDCKTWSEPRVVGDCRPGELGLGDTCMMGGYLYVVDGKLYNIFCEYEYAASMYDSNGTFIPGAYSLYKWQVYATYTTDGENWCEPFPVGAYARMNEAPRQSLTDRWFGGCGQVLSYSDDPDGENWLKGGLSNDQVAAAKLRGARILTECSWYQTDDYVIHMMLRSNAGYIWMSESYDNGETWTDPYPTQFTSASTMANFGRLPDGRYYFVGSVTYDQRYPLDLYISEDGYNFNKAYTLRDEIYEMQQDGWAKGGDYAYPEVTFHDGYMYIFYSKQKEVMELTRVALSDIV